MKYRKEIDFLSNEESKNTHLNHRVKITEEELNKLQNKYPNIPKDFLSYLQEIGAGTILDGRFKVMKNLFDFNDIGLENLYDLPDNIKLFGDNFTGDFAGFDISSPEDIVIEFWHDSNDLYYTGLTFRAYIRSQMSMTNNVPN